MVLDDHNSPDAQKGVGDTVNCRLAITSQREVIVRGTALDIRLSLVGDCELFVGVPVSVEMTDSAGGVIFRRKTKFASAHDVLTVSIQTNLASGMYQVSGRLDGTAYWTVMSILVTDTSLDDAIESGRAALEAYGTAVANLDRANANSLAQSLSQSARLFGDIHSYWTAIAAWRDAASIYLTLNQRNSGEESVRQALAHVFDMAESRTKTRYRAADQPGNPTEILSLKFWDVQDLVELAISIRGPVRFQMPRDGRGGELLSRSDLRGFLEICAEFAVTSESYRSAIVKLLCLPDFAEVCYRGLLAFGASEALPHLGAITAIARQHPDEVSLSALICDLASPNLEIIQDALNEARYFSRDDQRFFVRTIFEALGLRPLFDGPKCSIWQSGKCVAEIYGQYDVFNVLLPYASDERYEVVQRLLVKVVGR